MRLLRYSAIRPCIHCNIHSDSDRCHSLHLKVSVSIAAKIAIVAHLHLQAAAINNDYMSLRTVEKSRAEHVMKEDSLADFAELLLHLARCCWQLRSLQFIIVSIKINRSSSLGGRVIRIKVRCCYIVQSISISTHSWSCYMHWCCRIIVQSISISTHSWSCYMHWCCRINSDIRIYSHIHTCFMMWSCSIVAHIHNSSPTQTWCFKCTGNASHLIRSCNVIRTIATSCVISWPVKGCCRVWWWISNRVPCYTVTRSFWRRHNPLLTANYSGRCIARSELCCKPWCDRYRWAKVKFRTHGIRSGMQVSLWRMWCR